MGDQADDVLRSFNMVEEDKKVYKEVKERFDQHFVKRRNTIYERAKFNQRRQEDCESADSFITSLYCLVEHCQYGDLTEEMIRDRIVAGVRDRKLSEKLQLDAELTLEKAMHMVRQTEVVRQQQDVVRGVASTEAKVEAVKSTSFRRRGYGRSTEMSQRTTRSLRPTEDICSRCGRKPSHSKFSCPAKNAKCHKCNRVGHYQTMCRSKVSVGTVDESSEEESFLGAVHSTTSNQAKPWAVTLKMNGSPIEFKIDTGADVTVIPTDLYVPSLDGVLLKPKKVLSGPNKVPLAVQGSYVASLQSTNLQAQEEVFVVDGLSKPLVGKPAILSLKLLSTLYTDSVELSIQDHYPELFRGLGKFSGRYTIKLKKGAIPFALSTSRRIAVPLLPKVRDELDRMEKIGVISKITDPTDWCSGMVVVPKPNGKVRICVDLTKLNKSVCREKLILPSVEDTLARLGDAKWFSKLDANSGFWQVELDPKSSKLTTFITPFGRYCFNRLPFGITSAPEHFQRKFSEILSGLDGVVFMMDDILIFGKSKHDHDKSLKLVLEVLKKHNVTLNKEKCKFSQCRVKFLGQIVDESGIRPDPEKVRAVNDLPSPTDVSELRRFLGMVNHLSKFAPHLSDKTKPLRHLLSTKSHWIWESPQQQAFEIVKKEICSERVLACYHLEWETVVSADESSYGLGAVLRQKQKKGEWRPVSFISRSLTTTEQRYAQIEKEALGMTWACERFQNYLLGRTFHIETDHKPLVPLMSSKNLEDLPLRVQRFRMRLMRFDFSISHVPGKNLVMADTLSRSPILNSPLDRRQHKV